MSDLAVVSSAITETAAVVDTSSKKRKREEKKQEKLDKKAAPDTGSSTGESIENANSSSSKSGGSAVVDPRTKLILDVKELIRKRDKARTELNFAQSDKLRAELSSMGVEVVDQKHGPSGWKFTDGSSRKLPAGVDIPADPNRKKEMKELFEKNSKAKIITANSSNNSNSNGSKSQGPAKVATQMTADADRSKELLQAMKPQLKANQRMVQGVLIEEVTLGMKGGENPLAKPTDKVKVHYIGRLKSNNKIFDQSKKPFQFTLGKGEVIRGWDIGVAGMAIGGQRILTIPPEKGYGLRGSPPVIPGNATLVFEVTLIDITSKRK